MLGRQIRLVTGYLVAIVLANLTVSWWGPRWSIVNAALLIGLDLTARDGLHELWQRHLKVRMAALIGVGSLLSWALNADAGRIALASFVAFAAAGIVDTIVYQAHRGVRTERVLYSNTAAAIVDSILFPLIAFGLPFLWDVSIGQAAAKIGGGMLWAMILFRGEWRSPARIVR